MKLLLDNNLSPKLVSRLINIYPMSSHVSLIGLERASDLEVWTVAKYNDYCLVSKDSDFNELVATKGFPPKVIWIRVGNASTAVIAELLETYYTRIVEFNEDSASGLLELR